MANLAKIPLVRERRQYVMEMLLSGLPHGEISTEIKEKYGKTEKTVQKDITIAYNMIKQSHDVTYESLVAKHVAMYYELWVDAKQLGDVKSAIAAQQAVEKLMGLHKPDMNATFIQSNTYNLEHLSELQIDKILEEAKIIDND